MAKFKKDDTVSFNVNANLNSSNAIVSAIVEKPSDKIEQQYIVKHTVGWKPTAELKTKYGLSAISKYIFLQESQLNIEL